MTIPRSLQALADLLERLASGAGADRIPGPPPGSHARGSSDTEGHPNAPAGAPEVKRDRCLDTAPTSGALNLKSSTAPLLGVVRRASRVVAIRHGLSEETSPATF